jgi:5'-nucleotidase
MRALITNDDGIDSVGLRTLAECALTLGLDVTVAAPRQERSGSSAALSAVGEDGRLVVAARKWDALPYARAYAVEASPALIVFVAVRGAFGEPPDVVLSGINHGPNTGRAVLHSGTVGAALTAQSQGIPSMAISLATAAAETAAGESERHTDATNWETARDAATQAVRSFLTRIEDDPARTPIVMNVNVPDVPQEKWRGLRDARPAAFGAVQAQIGARGVGYLTTTFAEINTEPEPDTDVALLRECWATVTLLDGPTEATAEHPAPPPTKPDGAQIPVQHVQPK